MFRTSVITILDLPYKKKYIVFLTLVMFHVPNHQQFPVFQNLEDSIVTF